MKMKNKENNSMTNKTTKIVIFEAKPELPFLLVFIQMHFSFLESGLSPTRAIP